MNYQIDEKTEKTTDRLFLLAVQRIKEEQPEWTLSDIERSGTWWDICGRLCRGETEKEIIAWIMSAKIEPIKKREQRSGYAG